MLRTLTHFQWDLRLQDSCVFLFNDHIIQSATLLCTCHSADTHRFVYAGQYPVFLSALACSKHTWVPHCAKSYSLKTLHIFCMTLSIVHRQIRDFWVVKISREFKPGVNCKWVGRKRDGGPSRLWAVASYSGFLNLLAFRIPSCSV